MVGLECFYDIRDDEELRKKYDEVWVITINSPNNIPLSFSHVPELAPTEETLEILKSCRTPRGFDMEVFSNRFAPQYLVDIVLSDKPNKILHRLIQLSSKGRRIAIAALTKEEERCYRSILGGFLQRLGHEVKAEKDYSALVSDFSY